MSSAALAEVVRKVASGGRHVGPELAAEATGGGDSPLTPRETDVLALARDGAPADEIAQRVSLSRGTVRNHLAAAIAGARDQERQPCHAGQPSDRLTAFLLLQPPVRGSTA
ncbi:helix-turn-helix domain-containing protein [Nonomuraea sp. KM90]|uniref:helix-turn-helix domain-containing protein n=1 Tax=Nonomuraea sp. KM90 TaxID=3457428 RepID=UPI003FCDAD5C